MYYKDDVFDLFIKAKREVLRQNSKILSSYAGLFWFSDDYKEVVDVKGLVEFTPEDVSFGKTVLPEGSHTAYKTKRFVSPRGRVELNNGQVTISVGENCSEKVIDYIISFMGLNAYVGNIRVIRDKFWDKK